jgi:hypothetical protein
MGIPFIERAHEASVDELGRKNLLKRKKPHGGMG